MFKKTERFSFKGALPTHVLSSPLFILKYEKNAASGIRSAIIVSKKVDKRATVRNKIKRLIREQFRLLFKELAVSYDIVLIVKKNIMVDEKRISEELMYLFKKAKIL